MEIIVYEKSMVGYVSYMNSNLYFDKDGIIVESTSEILPGNTEVDGAEVWPCSASRAPSRRE